MLSYENSMNFYGLAAISFGLPEAPDDSYETYALEYAGSYKKFIFKDGACGEPFCKAIYQKQA